MDGPSLIAGFWGALVSCFFMKDLKPKEIAGVILAGTVFPAYAAVTLASFIHLPNVLTALFLGYGGNTALRLAYQKFFVARVDGGKNA